MSKLALQIPGSDGTSQELTPPKGIAQVSGGIDTIGKNFTNAGFSLLFTFAVIVAAIFMILSGIQLITSGSDAEKIASARRRLLYSIIGLVVVAASFLIVSVVITMLGGNAKFFLNIK